MKQILILIVSILLLSACLLNTVPKADLHEIGDMPVEITIEPGENYLHNFPIFWIFSVKNPPQIAIWSETPEGEYLETLMITERTGRQSWRKAPGDSERKKDIRRPEALPVWEHRRGIPVTDPEFILPDAVTQATPKKGLNVDCRLPDTGEVVLYLEINHSTDFNDFYTSDAAPDRSQYSGGPWGSGQPSLVYRARISSSESGGSDSGFTLIGHGSPDGSDGSIDPELSGITSALSILDGIRISFPESYNEITL